MTSKETPSLGHNRTGIGTSPDATRKMVQGTDELMSIESSTGDGGIALVRQAYVKEAEPLGTVPPPTKLAATAKVALQALKGARPTQLIDKLGERLAFERTGVRFYEALISKYQALGGFSGGPDLPVLEKIMMDEHKHFALLSDAVRSMGGDPTVITPSADLQATIAKGIGDVLVDPRTTFLQCLEAIEVAELADNEGWDVLVELAREATSDGIISSFERAREDEAQHLALLRAWIAAAQARVPVPEQA